MALLSKPRPVYSEMPWHIRKRIIESADTWTRHNLRVSSKSACQIINALPTHYDSIKLRITIKKVEIELLCSEISRAVCYKKHKAGFLIAANGEENLVVGKGDYIDRTFRFLEAVFKHSESRVSELKIKFEKPADIYFNHIFQQLNERFIEKINEDVIKNHKFWGVNHLSVRAILDHDVNKFLECCQPGVLNHISLYAASPRRWFRNEEEDVLGAVIETSQWKLAKRITTNLFLRTPYQSWGHLQFTNLSVHTLSLADFRRFLEHFQREPSWQTACFLLSSVPDYDMFDYFFRLPKFGNLSNQTFLHRRIDFNETEFVGVTFDHGVKSGIISYSMRKYTRIL